MNLPAVPRLRLFPAGFLVSLLTILFFQHMIGLLPRIPRSHSSTSPPLLSALRLSRGLPILLFFFSSIFSREVSMKGLASSLLFHCSMNWRSASLSRIHKAARPEIRSFLSFFLLVQSADHAPFSGRILASPGDGAGFSLRLFFSHAPLETLGHLRRPGTPPTLFVPFFFSRSRLPVSTSIYIRTDGQLPFLYFTGAPSYPHPSFATRKSPFSSSTREPPAPSLEIPHFARSSGSRKAPSISVCPSILVPPFFAFLYREFRRVEQRRYPSEFLLRFPPPNSFRELGKSRYCFPNRNGTTSSH